MPVFTTERIEELQMRKRLGHKLSREESFEYNNIDGTRKPYLIFEFTDQERNEYINCRNKSYFANNYCKIKREDGIVGNITLRDYQEEILNFYLENRFQIHLKSRQIGSTAVMAIIFLNEMLYNEHFNILCVSLTKSVAKELIENIKQIYKFLPFFLKQGITSWNQNSIQFENGSRIVSNSRNFDVIGYTPDIFYVDECAKFTNDRIRFLMRNIFPVMSARRDNKLILTSTPNGYNAFYELVRNSEDGRLPFGILRTPYTVVPNRDENWRNYQIMLMGSEEAFRREFELNFDPGLTRTEEDDSQFEDGFEE